MKRHAFSFVSCIALFMLAATSARAQFGVFITAPAPLNNNATVDVGDDGNAQVTTDGLGNWLAVWGSNESDIVGGIGTDIDILFARSSDSGETWTDPAPLNNNAAVDTGRDDRPQLTTDGNGNWLAVWESTEAAIGGGIGTDVDIIAARSTDNGVTWTDPAPLNSDAGGDVGGDTLPQVKTDGQGVCVAVWKSFHPHHSAVASDTDIAVARSTDSGVTWTAPALLNNNALADSGPDHAPQLATDGHGNWLTVWYSAEPDIGGGIGTDFDIVLARSSDHGVTWMDPAPLNNNAGSDTGLDHSPQLATDGQGNWVVVWSSSEPDIAGGIGTDHDVLVARSTDGGATWTDPAPLNGNAGSDLGNDMNAQIATDGQGNWATVWQAEGSADGGHDPDVLVARSSDNGVTWTAPGPLNTNAGSAGAGDLEAQLTTDRLGNWVAVWWSNEPNLDEWIDWDFDILTSRFALPDCNLNGVGDGQDLADGRLHDADMDGFADECQSSGDFDGDGDVDLADFAVFGQCFAGPLNPPAVSCPSGADADFDADGDVDLSDYAIFSQNFTGSS